LALGLIWLGQVAVSLGNAGLAVLGPFLVNELSLNHAQLGFLTTALYAGSALMLVPAGRLSDRLAPRSMFLLMALLAATPLLGVAAVWEYQPLLILVLVYGLAHGGMKPPAVRAIADWFPPHRRGLPIGVNSTGLAAAALACGLVVPVIVTSLSWHAVLPAVGCATVLVGGFAWLLYRDPPAAHSAHGGQQPGPRMVALVRHPGVLLLCAVTLLQAGVQMAIATFLVLFLRERVGLGQVEAGALFGFVQLGGASGRIGWGIVSDALFGGRSRGLLLLVSVLAALSSVALAQLGPDTPRPLLWGLLGLTGLAGLGWNGLSSALAVELVGRPAAASSTALTLTAFCVGVMLMPPVFGYLVDRTDSYIAAFQVGALASIVAAAVLTRIHPRAMAGPQV
jgi:sugar phosphate permease